MKHFIKQFKNSLTNPAFYQEVQGLSTSKGLKYILKLGFIFAIFMYVSFVSTLYLSDFKGKAVSMIETSLPADFSGELKNGELSINQPLPFIIPMSNLFDEKNDKRDDIKNKSHANLVYIDTSVPATLDSNKLYDTMLYVSKDKFIFEREGGVEVRSMSFAKSDDIAFDRNKILSLLDYLAGFIWIILLFALIPFTMIGFFSLLSTAFFASLIVYIILKIMKKDITWKKSMRISLFASTGALILNIIPIILGSYISVSKLCVLLTVIIVVYFMTRKINSEKNINANVSESKD